MTRNAERRLLALGSRELRRRADARARMLVANGGERLGEGEDRVAELHALADDAEQMEQRWVEWVALKLRD